MRKHNGGAFRKVVGVAAALALTLTACNSGAEQDQAGGSEGADYPTKQLDWIVSAGEGGGTDIMTRLLADLVKTSGPFTSDIVVENRPGGGGARGYGHLFANPGNPYLLGSTSSSFVATPLQSETGWTPADFTPVALMARDYSLFLVKGDSGIETLEDFVQEAERRTVTVGSVGTVNLGFMIPSLLAEEAGIEWQHVPFAGFGELQSAILSNSVDALTSEASEVAGLLASGDLRAIAYAGPERPTGLDVDYEIPTFAEAGYPIPDLFEGRGVVLPPDVDQAVVDWWITAFKKASETEEWKSYLDSNLISQGDLYGADFGDYLNEMTETYKRILANAGVAQ